jgi:hypothetical protein
MLSGLAGSKAKSYILLPETRGDVKQNQRLAGRIPDRQDRQFLFFNAQCFPFPEFSGTIFIIVRKIRLVHIIKGE